MLPNDYHPGSRCSCADCLRRHPSDMLKISTWRDDGGWHACRGEYDLDTSVFTGKTERQAIDELLDNFELVDGTVLK